MAAVADLRTAPFHKKGRGREGEKFRLVLNTARSVFLEHGYDRASMDMISHEAGVSKATVYAYFENKQQLLLKLVQEECESVVPAMFSSIKFPIEDIELELQKIARKFTSIFLNNHGLDFYRLIISNVKQFPELAVMFMEVGPQRHQAEMAKYLNQAVQQGLLEIDDVELAVKQFFGLVAADLPLTWLLSIQPDSLEQYETLINGGVRLFLKCYGVINMAC